MGWFKTFFKVFKKKEEGREEVQLARNLSRLYDEICIASERMQSCNSDFIQTLHEQFETDERYKNFKIAVLSTCLTVIQDETNLSEYISDLDQEIEKMNVIVQKCPFGKRA